MPIQIPFPIPSHGYAMNSKMRINLEFLVNQFNEFNTGAATWDTVAIGTPSNSTGTLTFWNSSNSNYLTFQAGATNANTTITWPANAFPNPSSNFMSFDSSGVGTWVSASAAFAPTAATYVVMSLSADLPNERRLNAGAGIVISDGGAGGNVDIVNNGVVSITGTANQVIASAGTGAVTLSLPQSIGTGSDVTFNSLRVGAGDATNAAIQINDANTGFYQGSGGGGNINVISNGSIIAQWLNSGLVFWNSGALQSPSLILRDTAGSNPTVTINPPTGFTSYTLTLPSDDGTSNQVLTTNGSGVLSWTTPSSSGANTALSNLASVAINTSLVSDTNNTDDLGTSSIGWKDLYLEGSIKDGSVTTITPLASGVAILGTNTNDSASAGFIGEYLESKNATDTNFPSDAVYGDATSLSLTAGDWDVTFIVRANQNSATWTQVQTGISAASGNNQTGLETGNNRTISGWASSSTTPTAITITISNFRVSLSSTTTYYAKIRASYSAGTPQYAYRFSARRVR